MKERIQTKLNSMASILMDNIIVPGERRQSGYDEVSASLYDKDGNKFAFKLSLQVTPKGETDDVEESEFETSEDKIDRIEAAIVAIQADIDTLKAYHAPANDNVVAVNDG